MITTHSPEAAGLIDNVQRYASELDMPLDKAVVVGSGVMVLAADAMGERSRENNAVSLVFPAESVSEVLPRLPSYQAVSTPDGPDHYRVQMNGRQLYLGRQWAGTRYDALRFGAQVTQEGIAFASLTTLLKASEGRPQDAEDIAFMKRLLDTFRPTNMGMACTVEAALGHTNATEQAHLLMPQSRQRASITPLEAYNYECMGMEGLRRMGVRYGEGFPDFKFLAHSPANRKVLWYNTMSHAREVSEDALFLARYMRLGEFVCRTLQLAGKWHDVDQTCVIANPGARTGLDELRSAQEFVQQLWQYGAPPEAALWGAYFIQGTQVKLDGTQVVGQIGGLLKESVLSCGDTELIPCDDAILAAQIGASADLGRLYEDYRPSLCLFPQRLGLSYPEVPDFYDVRVRAAFRDFLEKQLIFLSNHEYALEEAQIMFGKQRQAMIDHVGELLGRDQQGDTPSTWQEIIKSEDVFAASMKKDELLPRSLS